MKKMVLMALAAMMMTSAAMAQDNKQERPNISKTEMAQKRTDQMVKQYGLDKKQAKSLQALNEKYGEKMGPRGGRHMGPRPEGKRPEGKRPEGQGGQHGDFGKQIAETMKAYEAELQKIMTPEQFKQYQADVAKQRAARGNRGPRGQRNGGGARN